MQPFHLLAAIGFATLIWVPQWAMAGVGHDQVEAAPAGTATAMPRFAAVSELFELVGVLNGKQITLYLDRAADNSPVTEALIELKIDGKKYQAAKQGAAEFEVVLTEVPKPGVLAVAVALSAGTDTALLVGEIDIRKVAPAHAAASARSWKAQAGWAAGAIAALAVLLTVGRRVLSSRQARVGGAT